MSKRLKITYTIVISIWLICIFIMWASNKYEDRKPEKLVEVYSENKEWKVTVVYDKPLLFQSYQQKGFRHKVGLFRSSVSQSPSGLPRAMSPIPTSSPSQHWW